MKDSDPILIKVEAAAALLSISRTSMYRLIDQRKVPHIKLNGSVRIPRRELEAWVQAQAQDNLKASS
jgi:excisionase family DNA binding protein